MGTNYFAAKIEPGSYCDCCGRFDVEEKIHIGKSSIGWCFSLHVIPEKNLNSLNDWKEYLKRKDIEILDEYGGIYGEEELFNIITKRKRDDPLNWNQEMLDKNSAEPGPNNLVRHKIGNHCIAHGEGPWDLITGEFR